MRILIGSALLFAVCGFAAADDKDKPAPLSGTWVREGGGFDLKVEFTGKDLLKMTAMADDHGAIVTSKYSVKDGLVTAKITKV